MDIVTLARWQSGTTMVYHFLFVPLTLGLVLLVALMETIYVKSGNPVYRRMAQFWGKLYIINYAVGFITGLIQEFQFGMSWSVFSSFVGNVFGVPLAIETLLAFFIDATFFGLWVMSWDVVSKKLHLSFIWLVTLGAYSSAVWILAANGFMQHPTGYELQNGEMILTNFSALFTNPNFLIALGHVITGSIATGAFFVTGISAYHLLKRTKDQEFFRRSLRIGMILAFIGSLLVFAIGGIQIEHVGDAQPMKRAILFNEPEEAARLQTVYEQQYGPGNYIPPFAVVYGSFHAMTIAGGFMFLLALIGLYLLKKDRFVQQRWFLWSLLIAISFPYIANISGWLIREIGRQPWVVQGILKTQDAVSPSLDVNTILISLIGFCVIYAILAIVDIALLTHYARHGAQEEPSKDDQQDQELEKSLATY